MTLPEGFTLEPNAPRSCETAITRDNDAVNYAQIYMMKLQSYDTFIDVPSSETPLNITNNDGN